MPEDESDIRREFNEIYSTLSGPHPQDQSQTQGQRQEDVEEVFSGIQRVIEGLEASSARLASGDYEGASEELRSALESTNCSACKKAIERSLVEVEYVSRLCNIGDEDCESGAEKLQERVDSLAGEMKTEFENLKKEVEADA